MNDGARRWAAERVVGRLRHTHPTVPLCLAYNGEYRAFKAATNLDLRVAELVVKLVGAEVPQLDPQASAFGRRRVLCCSECYRILEGDGTGHRHKRLLQCRRAKRQHLCHIPWPKGVEQPYSNVLSGRLRVCGTSCTGPSYPWPGSSGRAQVYNARTHTPRMMNENHACWPPAVHHGHRTLHAHNDAQQ